MESHMMASLRSASADIVHNMAKKAATRILVSEREGLRFQQELFATKEHALHMLLTLKHIMDSKIAEVEKASLIQTKRVQELEMQLKEAEETVRNLRGELKRTSDELEKMKRNLLEAWDKQTSEEHASAAHVGVCIKSNLEDSDSTLSPHLRISDAKATTLDQRPAADLPIESIYVSNPDLASIIMRTKEPELYRNGCTQRIRALGQNMFIGKLSLPGKSNDQWLNVKYPSVVGEVEKMEGPCATDLPDEDMSGIKDVAKPNINCDKGQLVKFFRRSSRKQKVRFKYSTTKSSMILTSQVIEHYPCLNFDMSISSENTSSKTSKKAEKDSDSHATPDSAENEKDSPEGGKDHGNVPACGELSARQVTEADNELLENRKTLLQHNDADVNRRNVCVPAVLDKTDLDDGKECKEDERDVEKSHLMRQDSEVVADAASVTPIQQDLETSDVPSIVASDLKYEKTCKAVGAPVQDVNGRFLKYTFRRKRKRDLSSHNENVYPEKKSTSKRRTTEKQCGLPVPQKSSLVMESSRDSRRLVQVARQRKDGGSVAFFFAPHNKRIGCEVTAMLALSSVPDVQKFVHEIIARVSQLWPKRTFYITDRHFLLEIGSLILDPSQLQVYYMSNDIFPALVLIGLKILVIFFCGLYYISDLEPVIIVINNICVFCPFSL